MDGLVKGLAWVGSRTEHYEKMVEFYRDTLGLRLKPQRVLKLFHHVSTPPFRNS